MLALSAPGRSKFAGGPRAERGAQSCGGQLSPCAPRAGFRPPPGQHKGVCPVTASPAHALGPPRAGWVLRALLSHAPRPGGRSPAQERVFQIFRRRMTMAARWDRSPVSRKMFMAAAVGAARRPRGSAATQDAAKPPREEAAKDGGSGRDVARDVAELPSRAGQPGRAGARWGHAPATPLKGPAVLSNRTLHPAWAADRGPRVLRNFRRCQRFPF